MVTSVFVRGFDFGTSEEDVAGHCAQAGDVQAVEMWGKGNAVVTFGTPSEAASAVKLLQRTTIGDNKRYIDVKLNDESKGSKGVKTEAGEKRFASQDKDPSRTVFVRGMDFNTTDDQFEAHMGQAGTMVNVRWFTKGKCAVTYDTREAAQFAIENLNQTTIDGNTRYIDVMWDNGPPSSGGPPAKRARTGEAGGAWVWVPQESMSSFGAKGKGKSSFGKGSGKGYGKTGQGKAKEDPVGSGRVFVRGFDFDTDDEQFLIHMGKAGPVHTVHYITKGSASVVYKSAAAARKALQMLHKSTVPGNSRYIDVLEQETR